MLNKLKHTQTTAQLLRFLITGIVSTLIHITTALYLIEHIYLSAMTGNSIAFILSFIFSYLVNKLWTFKEQSMTHKNKLFRYMITTSTGLAFNIVTMSLIVNVLGQSHRIGLLFVVIFWPAINFILAKFWVFR